MTVAPTWSVSIDVDDEGFSFVGEEVNAQLIEGKINCGMKDELQRLADPMEARLVFNDTARYFSPENAASIGLVKGRFIRVNATYNAVTYTLFHGEIWRVHADEQPYRAVVECRGALIHAEMRVEIEIVPSGSVDEIIIPYLELPGWREYLNEKWILDEVGHSELGETTRLATHQPRSIDVGRTTLTYFGLQYDSPKLKDVMRDLAEAEWGWFYDLPSTGQVVFLGRQFMLLRMTADFSVTQDDLVGLDYRVGDRLVNEVYLNLQANTVLEDTVLWTSVAAIRFKPGESERVIRFLQDDGRLLGVESDFAAWNFVFKDEADGGDVVTPAYQLEALVTGARLTVRNDTSGPIWLQIGATITGDAIISEVPLRETVRDNRSFSFYGAYPMELRLPPFADAESADYLADFLLYSRAEPTAEVLSVKLQNHTATNLVRQLDMQMADRLDVSLENLDHDRAYNIIGYEQVLWNGGLNLTTEVRLIPQYGFWILGQAGYSELGETTILGY
jgi:hypothetical protein